MTIFVNKIGELDLSDYTATTITTTTATTTTTPEDDHGCNWDDWSQVVDWEMLSGPQEDFHDLFESIMAEGCNNNLNHASHDTMMIDDETQAKNCSGDLKGLRLVHLLMAAAEALTGTNKSRDLAQVILVRLKELVSPTDGTNMERLAAYFTEALMALLDGNGGGKHHLLINGPHCHRDDQTDLLGAFQLLQDMSPYVKFGHFTANQAILEAVTHDRRVHIVDYDIMEGIQWASLMQALVSRKDGPPAPHLRITALSRNGNGLRSIATVQETGRRLITFAASIGQPFSFHQCKLYSDETFRPSSLKLAKGEAIVINCMLHLPHFNYRAPNSVASFLSGAKTLNPRLVTLVEEEEGPALEGGFVGRFMDSLHHYSAVYDSLEAGFPLHRRARALVERVFLGPCIVGSLSRLYCGLGQEEDRNSIRGPIHCSWRDWLAGAGFCPMNISFSNHCQAKLLLGLFNDGYRVEKSAPNKIDLGWKSRRLLSASIWASPDLDL